MELFIEFLIFLNIIIVCFALGAFWRIYKDVLAPGILLIIMYFFYTIFFEIAVLQHLPTIDNRYEVSGLPQFIFVQLIGLGGIILGGLVALIFKRDKNIFRKQALTNKTSLFSLVIWFFIGWIFMFLLIRQFGGLSGFIDIGYSAERYNIVADTGYLGFGVDWLIFSYAMATGLVFFNRFKDFSFYGRAILILILMSLPIFLYLLIETGGRSNIIKYVLICMLTYHFSMKKINFKFLLLSFIPIYIVAVMYGHIRNQIGTAGILGAATQSVEMLTNDPTILFPTSFGEFINPARALYDIVNENIDWNYLLGRTYIDIPLIFLPKAVLPDRPKTLGEWYVATIDPAFFDSGGGLGFFTVAEGFINFGFVGAFFHMFLISFLMTTIYQAFRPYFLNKDYKINIFLFSVAYSFLIITIMRIDVAAILKTLTFGYLLPTFFLRMTAAIGKDLKWGTTL